MLEIPLILLYPDRGFSALIRLDSRTGKRGKTAPPQECTAQGLVLTRPEIHMAEWNSPPWLVVSGLDYPPLSESCSGHFERTRILGRAISS